MFEALEDDFLRGNSRSRMQPLSPPCDRHPAAPPHLSPRCLLSSRCQWNDLVSDRHRGVPVLSSILELVPVDTPIFRSEHSGQAQCSVVPAAPPHRSPSYCC
ncbi:hypothetical protein PHYPO_G00117640 [Pangasianodon hypophthalmus]|uniref:Uncharacterized protein n=1 Tax=Pangasianodon hypophthalmus TaxID=310915 RepID=A0A5N5KZV7_PANHP|nr:hypothetical protein PHYPO_G00117640 [Pangasianodon hypophthalmus]